jgi:hypothetical protein
MITQENRPRAGYVKKPLAHRLSRRANLARHEDPRAGSVLHLSRRAF